MNTSTQLPRWSVRWLPLLVAVGLLSCSSGQAGGTGSDKEPIETIGARPSGGEESDESPTSCDPYSCSCGLGTAGSAGGGQRAFCVGSPLCNSSEECPAAVGTEIVPMCMPFGDQVLNGYTGECALPCSSSDACPEGMDCDRTRCVYFTSDAEEPMSGAQMGEPQIIEATPSDSLRCSEGCRVLSGYAVDEEAGCVNTAQSTDFGCACGDDSHDFGCVRNAEGVWHVNDPHWFTENGAAAGEWSECTEVEAASAATSCDFSACDVAPPSACSKEDFCATASAGCDGGSPYDGQGCQRVECETDEQCGEGETCTPFECDPRVLGCGYETGSSCSCPPPPPVCNPVSFCLP